MIKPSYGVIVGRFQVAELTEGHLELFRQVRTRHNAIIVLVGCSPAGLSQKDPLDFPTRQKMIQAKFPEFIVQPLMDTRTDEEWSKKLDACINDNIVAGFGEVILYGSRDSFIPHYLGSYKPVELCLSVDTKICATDSRQECSNKVIESPEFRAGMIYAAHHHWPEILPCVDVAIMPLENTAGSNGNRVELLLAKKVGDPGWRFVGGHVEEKHRTLDQTVKEEVMEETSLDVSSIEYIGNAFIDDWRYRGSGKVVQTHFFIARVYSMGARALDDLAGGEVKWLFLDKLRETDFVPEHKVLYHMFSDYLANYEEKEGAVGCASV